MAKSGGWYLVSRIEHWLPSLCLPFSFGRSLGPCPCGRCLSWPLDLLVPCRPAPPGPLALGHLIRRAQGWCSRQAYQYIPWFAQGVLDILYSFENWNNANQPSLCNIWKSFSSKSEIWFRKIIATSYKSSNLSAKMSPIYQQSCHQSVSKFVSRWFKTIDNHRKQLKIITYL